MTASKCVVGYCYLGHSRGRWRFVKTVVLSLAMLMSIIVLAIAMGPSLWIRFKLLTSYTTETVRTRSAITSLMAINNTIASISANDIGQPNVLYTKSIKLNYVQVKEGIEVKDVCTFPDIDPFDPAVLALTKFYPTITCKGGVPHLVYLSGETIKVNHSRTVLVGNGTNKFKECMYRTVAKAPETDFKTVVLFTSEPFNNSITIREIDDDVVVDCYDSNKTVLSKSYFSFIHVREDLEALLMTNYKKHLAMNAPKEVMSVLMIGIDGNSKQNFQRMMPKTRNFLLNDLNAVELHKYNKVGEKTYSNLLPLLTGKHEDEFERGNWTYQNHFDDRNDDFLWTVFRKAGYRTCLLFDHKYLSAFHYLKRGWNKPPVDYYYRTVILMQHYEKLMGSQGTNCVGDVPAITLNHGFWIKMAATFNNSKTRPYFGFSFSSYLTHDDQNKASSGDELYLDFLKELADKNVINNTVIVFFSDHGERFGPVRWSTYNGMIESRTPYIFLVFPHWFRQKYPELMKVLQINQDRLTTNTDLHETLRDLINFQGKTRLGDINKRGISLFQEIPRERTCEHAEIPIEYCVCNKMTQTNVSSSIALAFATAVLDRVNSHSRSFRFRCAFHHLQNVKSVMKLTQNNMSQDESLYQIIITASPSGGIYEATLQFSNSTKTVYVNGDVIRLNMYRGQADCIDNPKVQPFCFCKNKLR